MLEKIGLPPKPALRGNNWVADATHCQGCSSQFTFINRKHHCRRCGGLFCNGCTQQRMVLRGQGDSPVRICEPCKKLEEAARFEMRQGRRAGRGLKSTPRYEDEVLNEILGQDGKQSTNDKVPTSSSQRPGSASSSSTKGFANYDDGDIQKIISDDKPNILGTGMGSSTTTPEELRQQALEEKRNYKILKGDGKSDEALRAFKRGKELERQADALEVHLKRARKKILTSGNFSDMQNRGSSVELGRRTKSLSHMGKEKDDIASELRELGWSDVDQHGEDRKSTNMSLEGEFSSIIGEIYPKTGKEKGRSTDKTEIVVLKKKALMLKRDGKLAQAKEELKRAKILEKKLEEEDLLGEAEDSDDELSALIHGMDDDKEEFSDLPDHDHGLEFDHFLDISDDLDGNFEVTDEDMMDPELTGALESLGWTEPENIFSKPQPFDREALLSEIQSLKREALNQKRAGNTEEAMAFLRKAKLLESDFNSSGSKENNTMVQKTIASRKTVSFKIAGNGSESEERNTNAPNNTASMLAPKSRLMIQRELLSLKKKALTLRREGKLNEADEELRKGAALEQQLMEIDKASDLKASPVNNDDNGPDRSQRHPDIHRDIPKGEGGEDDVTEQDMSDPAYLSLLRDLGWKDDNNDISNSASKPSNKDGNHFVPVNDASLIQHSPNILIGAPRRSKFEIQRELLGLKRKSLALRREGKAEDAEEVLKMAKELEAKMAEMEAPKKEVLVEATVMKGKIFNPPVETAVEEGMDVVISEEDMHDPALNSMLINLGWKDEEGKSVTVKKEPVKEATSRFTHTMDLSTRESSSGILAASSRSEAEIQRELLALKRKALALRRKGEMQEAEEILRMAESLEAQMEDFGNRNKDFPHNEGSGVQEVAMEFDQGSGSSVVGSSKNVAESLIGLERINNKTNSPLSRKTDHLICGTSPLPDDKSSLSVGVGASSENPAEMMKAAEIINHSTSPGYSMSTLDLLTGDDWGGSKISTQKQKEEYKFGSVISSQARPPPCLDSSVTLSQDQGCKDNVATQKRRESTDVDEKPSRSEPNAVQDYDSQDHLSLHQEILAHKRKAVTLKREGKLAEAREELRRAKLLEKSMEDGCIQPNTASTNISSDASHVVQKKQDSSNVAAKPLSGRDRFRLQQESLGHKRQALKLRREGRMEEAEAEFERAKALETQLEELAGHDSGKLDAVDDVTVEDFLDPQLLSALKAVGLEDVGVASKGPERRELVKPNVAKIEDTNQDRIQLEERIKAEKIKAVNLKRSGKQAEALDALRRAKLYEKKLNSMISG